VQAIRWGVTSSPSRQIIARTLNFFSCKKLNYKIFRSAREGMTGMTSCHVTGLHTTTNEVRAHPLVNLCPKCKHDVQIFGHDITSHRRAPPHVNRQNASANLQCSQCSPNNKIDPKRLIIGKSQEWKIGMTYYALVVIETLYRSYITVVTIGWIILPLMY
jgi:hypothetical protein